MSWWRSKCEIVRYEGLAACARAPRAGHGRRADASSAGPRNSEGASLRRATTRPTPKLVLPGCGLCHDGSLLLVGGCRRSRALVRKR